MCPRFGLRSNFPLDQLGQEALSFPPVQGVLLTVIKWGLQGFISRTSGPVPPPGLCYTWAISLQLLAGLTCQVCGAAVLGCFCTSSTACERGNEETPQAWRDPRSLQMSGAAARLCLPPLCGGHGLISPWGFPWAPAVCEPGAGQGGCLAPG